MKMLSIVILTFNSQKYLKEVLDSASFANEIVILDSGSSDHTLKISKEAGAKIYHQEWLGFGKQKQKAIDLASNDWVFVLDSDELITPSLKKEIEKELKKPQFSAYMVPRLNYFFKKAIYYGGLYPDKTLRLFDKTKAHFDNREVHERVITNEPIGSLKNPMIHYAYESINEFITKQNRYSTLGAKPNRIKAIFAPIWTFIRMYVIKQGFRDGWEGYIIARLYAQYTFWKYVKGSNE